MLNLILYEFLYEIIEKINKINRYLQRKSKILYWPCKELTCNKKKSLVHEKI